jgi:hypothetical protein
MSIGADIAEVLNELGMVATVSRPGTTSFQEKIEVEVPYRISQPFIREFLAEGGLRYNTRIQSGDILVVSKSGYQYLVMSLLPEGFEDEIIEWTAFLYKCNRKGIVLKQVDTDDWDANYQNTMRWEPVYEEIIPFLLYDKQAFDRAITLQYTWEQFASTSNELYMSGWYEIPTLGRLRIFEEDFSEWKIWSELTTYSIGAKVLDPDEYRLFVSLVNNNTDNHPILDEYDEYEVDPIYWREVKYMDLKIERVDLNRFENVNVFSVAADVR